MAAKFADKIYLPCQIVVVREVFRGKERTEVVLSLVFADGIDCRAWVPNEMLPECGSSVWGDVRIEGRMNGLGDMGLYIVDIRFGDKWIGQRPDGRDAVAPA